MLGDAWASFGRHLGGAVVELQPSPVLTASSERPVMAEVIKSLEGHRKGAACTEAVFCSQTYFGKRKTMISNFRGPGGPGVVRLIAPCPRDRCSSKAKSWEPTSHLTSFRGQGGLGVAERGQPRRSTPAGAVFDQSLETPLRKRFSPLDGSTARLTARLGGACYTVIRQ